MEKEIVAYSIQQAFAYLQKGLKEKDQPYPDQMIDISELDEDDQAYMKNILPKVNVVAGWKDYGPDLNPNQIQTQVKDTKYPPGDKKWKQSYLAVFDTPWGDEVVPGSKKDTKKETVEITRLACQEQNRDAFVIMGKTPVDFVRCTAQVLYKPSPKQKAGLYKFIW